VKAGGKQILANPYVPDHHIGSLLGLFFDPGNGGDMILQNIS
jgi:hypothetical protein